MVRCISYSCIVFVVGLLWLGLTRTVQGQSFPDDPSACLSVAPGDSVVLEDSTHAWRDQTLDEAKQTGDFDELLTADSIVIQSGVSNTDAFYTSTLNGRVWCYRIDTPVYEGESQSRGLQLRFDPFLLPVEGEMAVYDDNDVRVLGPYTSSDNASSGFITSSVPFAGTNRTSLLVSYYEPNITTGDGAFTLASITNELKNTDALNGSLDCHLNAGLTSGYANQPCPRNTPWEAEIRAQVQLVEINRFGNRAFRKNLTLVNRSSEDLTPYFLTASHALHPSFEVGDIITDTGNREVLLFNYQSSQCDTSTTANEPEIIAMAPRLQVVARGARNLTEDVMLLKALDDVKIPQSYKAYYAGWDRSGNQPTEATTIGHPREDVKSIAFASTIGSGTYAWYAYFNGTTNGTIEKGSSGSPLYNEDQRITGHLYGGPPESCGAQGSFPKFSRNWSLVSGDLDPSGTGMTYLNRVAGFDLSVQSATFADRTNDRKRGFFRTAGSIDAADVVVDSTGRLILNARESITMQGPFTVHAGADFEAVIDSGPSLTEAGVPETYPVQQLIASSSTSSNMKGAAQKDADNAAEEEGGEKRTAPSFEGEYLLEQTGRNPFRNGTSFALRVKESQTVKVEAFDIMGRQIATLHNGPVPASRQTTFTFNGQSLAAGVYLVRVQGDVFSETRKVVRIR